MATPAQLKASMLRALDGPSEPKSKKKKEDNFAAPPAVKNNIADVKPAITAVPQSGLHPARSFVNVAATPKQPATAVVEELPKERASIMNYKAPEPVRPIQSLRFDIIQYLKKIGKDVTPAQIKAETGIDVLGNPHLMDDLQKNAKVMYEDGLFSFKSEYRVKSKAEVLQLVRQNPDGILLSKLKESYAGVVADVQALAKERQIYLINNKDKKTDVLFPVDEAFTINIAPRFKELWIQTPVPDEAALPDELRKFKITPMTQATPDVRFFKKEDKEKKKKQRKITKFQNVHMEGFDPNKDQT